MLKKGVTGSLFLLCVLFFNAQTHGQWAIPWQMRGEATLERLFSAKGFVKPDLLYGIPAVKLPDKGTYIDPKWNCGSFLLVDPEEMNEGYLIKYDMEAKALSVDARNGIKVIEGNKIKSIVWLDSLTNTPRYFVNAKEYRDEGVLLTGLLEVLVEGQVPLFAQSYLSERETGFFAGLFSWFDTGTRQKRYEVNKIYYSGNGSSLTKIISTKDMLLSFGDFYWEMEEYIKTNKLDVSMQSGLQKVFEYYNAKFERLSDY